MKRPIRGLILLCAVLLSLCASVFAASIPPAETSTSLRVIRVGFPRQPGLTETDKYGNRSGYTYEYLQEIAQYTGWEYEFVEVPGEINQSLTTMMDMLQKGEIDLLGGMVRNEATEQMFAFPEYSYGASYLTLGVSEDNTQINRNNFQKLPHLRIALYQRSAETRSSLIAFCKLNNISYSIVECENSSDALAAMSDGRADVIVGKDLSAYDNIRTIAQFAGSPFYFATHHGNSELLAELNRTILTIRQIKPAFDTTLYDKYFSADSLELYLSADEQDFIKRTAPIRIAMPTSAEPIQFFNASGVLSGIACDFLTYAQTETGLRFIYMPVGSFAEAFSLLEDGSADAICGIPYDYELAQTHGLIMANSFLTTQMALVTKPGHTSKGAVKTVGIVDRGQAAVTTATTKIVPYPTALECMRAVREGKLDSAYLNMYSAEYFSHQAYFKGLRMVPQADRGAAFCIGVKKPISTSLISILNKVTTSLSTSDLESMIYRNTARETRQITLKTFVEENVFLSVGILASVFGLLLLCGIVMMRLRLRADRRLHIESQRYVLLSELANEYLYEYDCKEDSLSLSSECAKLFALPRNIAQFTKIMSGEIAPPANMNLQSFRTSRDQLPDSNELLCPLPSGEERWFRYTMAEVRNDNGELLYLLGKLTDVQREKEEKARLEQRALRDGLTGIYNAVTSRNIIDKHLHTLSKPGALLMIDVDHFKTVNDELGHYTGDLVLQDLARLLEELSGVRDIVGRLGGDEFIAFIDAGDNPNRITSLCQTLCTRAHRAYENADGKSLDITISVGGAYVRTPCAFEDVYQTSDKALYTSKSRGRDCYTLVEHTPPEQNS